MENSKYKLRYLPMFYDDLEREIDYIANELKNPEAANCLIDEVRRILHNRQNKNKWL